MPKERETERETFTPPASIQPPDTKRQALTSILDAIVSLPRSEQLDVLRAAANFCGLVVIMEQPR